MGVKEPPIATLSEMAPGSEADLFLLFVAKEELLTKTGKSYFKVSFRDAGREISFPIWGDSPWAEDCRVRWTPSAFYRVRATYRETNFGPQLEIRKIREVNDADRNDGFDPAMCLPQSQFEPQKMYDELHEIIRNKVEPAPLRKLVEAIFKKYRDELLVFPAARHNHHAYRAGLLEHTLSVTKTCVFLAEKYADYYAAMQPSLQIGLVVAGGALHDIGKLFEYENRPEGASYSAEGAMLGHMLLGRDIVRDAAQEHKLDRDTLLRLEHVVIAHQRLPEWGAPKPPMTPEALLVHYADDMDAKMNMMAAILRDDRNPGPTTSRKNVLMQEVYRGIEEKDEK